MIEHVGWKSLGWSRRKNKILVCNIYELSFRGRTWLRLYGFAR